MSTFYLICMAMGVICCVVGLINYRRASMCMDRAAVAWEHFYGALAKIAKSR